ncbi:MAG: hypothetical protein U9R75_04400 [Candidatus Thermoplasmatota archaeon]|nr:hypothetical protein [Candidatus Thermoplasmatota archaeon]
MQLNDEKELGFPPEDVIFRLRAKMDDNSYTAFMDGGRSLIAFRVEGEKIDLLRSLEYLSEFLTEEALESAEKVLIISDREFEMTPAEVLGPKMEAKRADDERLFSELKEKLRDKLKPLVFTVENDILELYRVAVRLDGSMNRTGPSVGLDLMKVDLPKEGDVVYLIFDDGYKKIGRSSFQMIVDEAMTGLRQGPSLAKDPSKPTLSRSTSLDRPAKSDPLPDNRTATSSSRSPNDPSRIDVSLTGNDTKALIRDFSRKVVALGYRKDTRFSRQDVNQIFFVGMSGPALLLKILQEREDVEPFLRILDHRKDSLGILVTKEWQPDIEALSRTRGFIYLDQKRAWRASEVVASVVKEGSG